MSDENTTPEAQVERTVKNLSGYDEGSVLPDGSVVKGTYDENNNLVGWHKEVPNAGGAE